MFCGGHKYIWTVAELIVRWVTQLPLATTLRDRGIRLLDSVEVNYIHCLSTLIGSRCEASIKTFASEALRCDVTFLRVSVTGLQISVQLPISERMSMHPTDHHAQGALPKLLRQT